MRALTLSLIVLLGLLAAAVSGYFVLQDWATLQVAHDRFEALATGGAEMRALFVAEAKQNALRINCLAEGVGVLLGAILAAIGLHGLCVRSDAGR